ncbi:MAG: type IX secretion system membrane protein PorP/SprF [Bacteroidota bacterium]
MRRNLTVLSIFIFLFTFSESQGQDPVFSQLTGQPLLVNPAFGGLFSGEMRASFQFKNQPDLANNQSANELAAFSIDTRYKAGNKDFWTLQGLLTSAKMGTPAFISQEITLGGGFLKLLQSGRYGKGTQYVSLAFQLGLRQDKLASDSWFSNQFDPNTGSINTALPNGEPNNGVFSSAFYPNLNAGILWSSSWGNKKGIYAGISMFHINTPQTDFILNSNNKISGKVTLVSGGEIMISENAQFLPVLYYLKQKSQQRISIGTPVRFNPLEWNELALRGGIWLHGSQMETGKWYIGELTFQSVFEIKTTQIGFSYALGQRPLASGNFSRNAFEINLIWIKPANYKMKIACPRL